MPYPSVADRCAGFALPLFSLRSERDAGIGEILDLVPLVRWAAGFGQRVVQLLPINETGPGEASPYNALSAFAVDPLYISLSGVRDAAPVAPIPSGGQRLPRETIREAKMRALAAPFARLRRARGGRRWRRFETYRAAQADWLEDYALYRALKDEQGPDSWESWLAPLRQRDPQALVQARSRLGERIDFLCFVQWIAAEQWGQARRAAAECGVWLKGDLPFVISRDSADVWARQDEFDLRCSVGAPPDEFSASGQSWGLPMYNWERIRPQGFTWWCRRARQARELYDLFRIDHVIGFFRTYAIPNDRGGAPGFVPATEEEQRAQGEAFLHAVLEASAGALAIAEDLGTVPPWVRQILHVHGVPGYKVFRWERRDSTYLDPRGYDGASVATTGTHDTDSLVDWWRALSLDEHRGVAAALRLPEADGGELTPALHRRIIGRLYEAGSAFVILPIQDLFLWTERINLPGTPSAENWNWRLPLSIERLGRDAGVRDATQEIGALAAAAERCGSRA